MAFVPDRAYLLNICREAYEKANLCTDNDENKEDWTYLYMMAKIDEKLDRSQLLNALKKYGQVTINDVSSNEERHVSFKALDILHENKAVYPRKLGHQTATSSSKGMLLGCYAVEVDR
jgi:hypothetical protein